MTKRKRLGVIVGIGALFVLCGWGYVRYFLSRPIAGPTVEKAPFDSVWTDRKVQLLGVGDSVTAGLGAKSIDHSYFRRMITNPSDEYDDMKGKCLTHVLPNLEATNLAMSGSTSRVHLDILQSKLMPHQEDVYGIVFMTTGGNDIIHDYGRSKPRECAMYGATLKEASEWIDNFDRRLDEMIELLTQSFPGGCEIYLGDIYDPTDGVGDAPSVYLPHWPDGLAIHERYNKVIHSKPSKYSHVFIVPMHATFLGHGSHCRQFWGPHYRSEDPYYWYYENIEDPNDRGYDALRRIFLNTLLTHTKLRQR
jgi:lysophospholipase L1-like esterase